MTHQELRHFVHGRYDPTIDDTHFAVVPCDLMVCFVLPIAGDVIRGMGVAGAVDQSDQISLCKDNYSLIIPSWTRGKRRKHGAGLSCLVSSVTVQLFSHLGTGQLIEFRSTIPRD